MAKNSPKSHAAGTGKSSVPFTLGAPLPLLDEIDDDTDPAFSSWRDDSHGMGDWESGVEDLHFSIE